MKRRQRTMAVRDQRASVFSASLMRLCDATGAVGAALVDAEGETVDYAGAIAPFDIKVAAAEWMVVLAQLREATVANWAETNEVFVRGSRKSFFLRALSDGYGLVVQLLPHAFALSRRGLHEAVRELCAEAGLGLPDAMAHDRDPQWRVEVRCDDKDPRRPAALWMGGSWSRVEILGRWVDATSPREAGFRVRLPTGAELTLVRERLGRWYADAPVLK
jgi:hypothetical protein